MTQCPRPFCHGQLIYELTYRAAGMGRTETWCRLLCGHTVEVEHPLFRASVVIAAPKRGRPRGWPLGKRRKQPTETTDTLSRGRMATTVAD